MDDLTFLRDSPEGNATILVCESFSKSRVSGLDLNRIESRVPLFAALFETTAAGPLCILDNVPREAVNSFLRYIYLDDYVLLDCLIDEQCSLLLHVQMYHLGEKYSCPELRNLARLHMLREVELTCSIGKIVLDLCEGIRYLYKHLAHATDIKDLLANYCITCCRYHQLPQRDDFCLLVHSLQAFHQDICSMNMANNFRDEAALDIVQLLLPPSERKLDPTQKQYFLPFRPSKKQRVQQAESGGTPGWWKLAGSSNLSLTHRPHIRDEGLWRRPITNENGKRSQASVLETVDETIDRVRNWKKLDLASDASQFHTRSTFDDHDDPRNPFLPSSTERPRRKS